MWVVLRVALYVNDWLRLDAAKNASRPLGPKLTT